MIAAATEKSTISEVARPIEVRIPTPVMASAAVATATVPPAKTTAAPDVAIASAECPVVVLARGPVLPVAGDHEQRVVDPDAEPDEAGDRDRGHGHVHRTGQQGDAADAGADRDDRQTDRDDRRDDGAEDDEEHEERDEEPDADVAGAVVLGVEERGVATELDTDAGDSGV